MLISHRYAQEIIDLFDRNNTLSEFNSGTYTGVSLYGLTLWCKYLPEDSIMAQHGPTMVEFTWSVIQRDSWIGLQIMILTSSFRLMQESCLRTLAPEHEEHGRPLGQSVWLRHAKISFIDGALVLGLDWQGELVIDR